MNEMTPHPTTNNSILQDPANSETPVTARYVQMRSGLLVPANLAQAVRRPIALDCFCGAGGFSLGIINAGFEVVCAIESDPSAALTYLTNLGQWPMRVHCITASDKKCLNRVLERRMGADAQTGLVSMPVCGKHRPPERTPVRSFIFGDIRGVTAEMVCDVAGIRVGELDCLVGSPPCQGFSIANNKRRPDDPRNQLSFEMARLIHELEPQTYAMENVPEFAKAKTPEGLPVMDVFAAIAERGMSYYQAVRHLATTKRVTMRRPPKRSSAAPKLETAQTLLFSDQE